MAATVVTAPQVNPDPNSDAKPTSAASRNTHLTLPQVDAELAEGRDVELGSGKVIAAPALDHGPGSGAKKRSFRWLPSLRPIRQDSSDRSAAGALLSRTMS